MSQDVILGFHQMLEMCKDGTLKVCEKVKPEDRFHQLKEGKAHPLWLLGHLANTIDVVGNLWTYNQQPIVAKKYKLKFAPDFANGDPITTDPENYPSWEELLEDYATGFDAFLKNVRETQDAELPESPRGPVREDRKDFFNSIGKNIQVMILHDTHHRGQMAMISKLNG
ncbi:MAG: DinB family protein [Candidatus Omnitrophica bacterium]|nr:DinB family protein [Candidatus Omnitrophota bacterium]